MESADRRRFYWMDWLCRAFPRLDHISFGIATTQEAFEHQPLDKLLWDFMLGYYRQREDPKAKLWASRKTDRDRDQRIREKLADTAERYAARIPGLNDKTWDARRVCGEGWALLGDAAGFADPVTGEGIYYALRSAELFAESRPPRLRKALVEDFGRDLCVPHRCVDLLWKLLGAPFWKE